MFKTRLLSGIVLVILALVFIITGNDLLLAVTGIISLIGLYELYRVFKIEKSCAGVVGGLATIVYYCNLKFQFIPDMMLFVIALLVVLMFVYVFSYPKYHTEQMLAAFFGVFYVSVMLSYVYQTRMLPGGAYIVWLIFLCSWGCDTCFVFQGSMGSTNRDIIMLCMICAIGAIISMIGDLTASAIKRNYDIKDYGRLIPGHGGILDRFDSVIFTAPIIYYLALYLIGK